jgi:hypothetical protein
MQQLKPILIPATSNDVNHFCIGLDKHLKLKQFHTDAEARRFATRYDVFHIALISDDAFNSNLINPNEYFISTNNNLLKLYQCLMIVEQRERNICLITATDKTTHSKIHKVFAHTNKLPLEPFQSHFDGVYLPQIAPETMRYLAFHYNQHGKLPEFINVNLKRKGGDNYYTHLSKINRAQIKLKDMIEKKVICENPKPVMFETPKLIVEKNTKIYSQCNFCMGNEKLYDIRGEGLFTVTTMCHKCMKKVYEMTDKLN